MLHYNGSVITIDPKGENFAVTARYRKEILGQKILILDPFEFVQEETLEKVGVTRASLNPLDLIASGSNMENQLTMIASLFSADQNGGKGNSEDGDFWNQEAKKLLVGILGLTIECAKHEQQSPLFQSFIDHLYSDDVVYSLVVELDKKGLSSFTHKAISAFLQKADRERSGVLSTAQSYLNPFISESLNNYLNSSSISPREIEESDKYTIYIVIPPSKLVSHSVLLQLWISTILNTIMEREAAPLKSTLFLLDECAQLGTLESLRKAITLLRGYGLRVWMFFQDFSQLERLYSDYNTMINNCGVFQSFGISRNSGAIPIIDIIGKYKPEELVQLGKTQQVVSLANNRKPQIMRLHNYLEDELFKGRFDPNPLFKIINKSRSSTIQPFPINNMNCHL